MSPRYLLDSNILVYTLDAREPERRKRAKEVFRRVALYERELRGEVESEHSGRFLVLDVHSGDYEIANEDLEASERLLERRPDAMLYGLRIGERAAYRIC